MRCGSTPRSKSRATRSVRTRVLPEPALAESQVEAVGSAAMIWRRVASFIMVPHGNSHGVVGHLPFAQPGKLVILAAVDVFLERPARGEALPGPQIGAQELLQPRAVFLQRVDRGGFDLETRADADELGAFHLGGVQPLESSLTGHDRQQDQLLVEELLLAPAW